ncbi:MAG: cellulase family glycosylhydrolase [Verrucomicrobia bacterium]|nr:cellulase family glycosylhydrolase [Verrucomicrobiota bacterium]
MQRVASQTGLTNVLPCLSRTRQAARLPEPNGCVWSGPSPRARRLRHVIGPAGCLLALILTTRPLHAGPADARPSSAALPRVRIAADGHGFVTGRNTPFVPMGVSYFRAGTGWAPQVWKQFDAAATRRDFARLKALGANCVRVFLSYGSFYTEPGVLSPDGLAKFDQFLDLAAAAGLYVQPTGPDHWEGTPEWARADRYADESMLRAQDDFWKLLTARYRDRTALFAYELLNEPEIRWTSPPMQAKWDAWVQHRYGSLDGAFEAWQIPKPAALPARAPVPDRNAPPGRQLLDYQRFREDLADAWTRRQVKAIKSVAPNALVTVGLIQWSVPVALAGPFHYSAFRPARQANFLDFLEVHFYPLAHGFYEYGGEEDQARNLAYLEAVVSQVARCGKPTVLAEFGWYGGGKLTLDGGRHPEATEAQQARWCRRAVETTEGLACGWLNWGLYDCPEAGDVSQLIGLLKPDGTVKDWGRVFAQLAARFRRHPPRPRRLGPRPVLDWDRAITDRQAMREFQEQYYRAYRTDADRP